MRLNLYVAVAYTAVWLSGNGAVAIHNLMEDAATAEISRSQVWQQIRNKSVLADTGNTVDPRAGGTHPGRGNRAVCGPSSATKPSASTTSRPAS